MSRNLADISVSFIVTRGRSGSTMLQNMLDAHPNICAPNESDFVLHLKSKYGNTTKWNERTINGFIKDLNTNRKYRLFWKVPPETLQSLFDTYDVASYADACKLVYLSFQSPFEKQEISQIVDKNPVNFHFLDELKLVFPKASFIHLVRDPRAVVGSIKKSFNKTNIPRIANSWVKANDLIELEKKGSTSIVVNYEDLVKNPEGSLNSITTFLDQKYCKDMLKSYAEIDKIQATHGNFSLDHHKNLSQPISTSFVAKWKTHLSDLEINQIGFITSEAAQKYGYDIGLPDLSENEINVIKRKTAKKVFRKKRAFFYSLPFPIKTVILQLRSFFSDKKYQK